MNVLKAAVAVGAATMTLLGAKVALAGTVHGVVFIHGTGDYPGTMTCTGSGSGSACVVANAASNYWGPGEVNSVRNGRAYAVVGFNGGSCSPWAKGGEYGVTDPNPFKGSCANASGQGNADVIAAQIAQFISYAGINELDIVTHSGGSNQARYILQNYTKSTNFTAVKNVTKRVITIAATTLGTYLANEADNGGITSIIAGLVGYGGEGVRFIRTDYMGTYNGTSSFFAGINNPVQGINFYSTGGVSGSTCYGFKLFGACIGITGPTLGGSSCASLLDDVGLLALHTFWLNYNDSSTARNSCSDGFISCMGSERLGNTFAYAQKQDHNQSRNTCNNLDVNIRNNINGTLSGFADFGEIASQVSPHQLDACGFGTYAAVTTDDGYHNGGSQTLAWTEGCTKSQLGNGNCDWDCVALYGQDAPVTQWDSTGTKPLAWGTPSDCTATTETYGGVTYTQSSTSPWAESGSYTTASGTTNTTFNGYTCTGTSAQCGGYAPSTYQWFYDPSYVATGSSVLSAGYCPQSWVGDGTCDECVLALYGSDGMDCAPGHIAQCGGIMSGSQPYSGSSYYWYNNPIYNETLPGATSKGGGKTSSGWLEWESMPAASDGVCEQSECTLSGLAATVPTVAGSTGAGTPCTSYTQCPGMLNCGTVNAGFCDPCTTNVNNATNSCNSTTWGWTGNVCNTATGVCYTQASAATGACNSNGDCAVGNCVNGGCTTQGTDCSATYAVTPRSCASNADCTGNACQAATGTCLITGEACSSDSGCSVPSGSTSTCSSGVCSCTNSNDCSGGAACNGGVCAATVTTSLCR